MIIPFYSGNKQLHEVWLYYAYSTDKETEAQSKIFPVLYNVLFQNRICVAPKPTLSTAICCTASLQGFVRSLHDKP